MIFIRSEIKSLEEDKKNLKIAFLQQQLTLNQKHLESQEKLHHLKHDVQHILTTISNGELSDDSILNKYKKELSTVAIPLATGCETLDYILNVKRNIAYENGIEMKCTISKNIKLSISKDDFSLLLINLLDNAIEHIGGNKIVYFSIENSDKYIKIKINNTVEKTIELINVSGYLVPKNINTGYGVKNDH